MLEQSLKDKTVKGVGWSAADAVLGQGVSFLVGLVLARLLSPDEYGLVGIVTIFTNILLGFIDCGFSNSLIRKQKITDEDYCTMFIVNMILSVVLYMALYFAAPGIAYFFNRQQLVALVRVMGAVLIFQAFSIVQATYLSRIIDFKTRTKASLISAVISGIVGIAMALLGFGVWSLVVHHLVRQFLYSFCLWMNNQWWPKLKFSIASFKYMWGFGWKLMLSGFLDRVWNQVNQAIVGKFYSPATLGQYSRSVEYANIFSTNLTTIIQRVSYPVLSQVQDEKMRMISIYRRVIKTTMFFTAISMFFLGAVAEPLLYCLIGPQWMVAASYLPLICIYMSTHPLQAINLNMLQVQGRTDIFLYLEIIKKVIAVGPICLGIFVGIRWMLIGTIALSVVCFFLNSHYTGKLLGYSSWQQLKDVSPSYAIAFTIAISVYFLKFLQFSYFVVLPIQIIFGIGVFFIICETIHPSEYTEIKKLMFNYFVKKR